MPSDKKKSCKCNMFKERGTCWHTGFKLEPRTPRRLSPEQEAEVRVVSKPYHGPNVVLTHAEVVALGKGVISDSIKRKVERALTADPRFRRPTE